MTRNDIDIARINTKLDNLLEEVREIKQKQSNMYDRFVMKEELNTRYSELKTANQTTEDKLSERIRRLEIIVYGMIGLILTGFIGALIAIVYKK